MKKTLTLTTLALLAGAVSGYSQGLISMVNYGGIQIFAPQVAAGNYSVSFNGYTGSEVTGSSGSSYSYSTTAAATYDAHSSAGPGYSVQLYIGNGTLANVSTLTPVGSPITTWYAASAGLDPVNGAYAGLFSSTANESFGTAGNTVTIAIAAWNNVGGTINSLTAAQAANDAWGFSHVAVVALGGGANAPTSLPDSTLQSFSLVSPASTPEPSTIALGVIGASTLLFRRRK